MPDFAEFVVYASPAIVYVLGFVSGYVVSAWVGGLTKADMQKRIALLITLLWVLSVTSGIILPDYATPVWVHAIMGGVAGFLFSGETGLSIFPGGANGAVPTPPDPPDPPAPAPRNPETNQNQNQTETEEPATATATDTDTDTETHP